MNKLTYNYNQIQFTKRNELLKDSKFTSYQEFLESDFWRDAKEKLKGKNYFKKCSCCGKEGAIEFHHFRYQKFLKVADETNIAPVCRSCHESVHKISREQNKSFKGAAKHLRKSFGYVITFPPKPIQVKILKHFVLGEGLACPKCSNPMERRRHSQDPTTYYFFTEWDYCKPCRHLQHYSEFKQRNTYDKTNFS